MHMMDWNAYRQQVVAGVGAMGKLSPDTVKGYVQLNQAGANTGNRNDGFQLVSSSRVFISSVWADGLRRCARQK